MKDVIHIHDLFKVKYFELELIIYCYRNDKASLWTLIYSFLFNRADFFNTVSEKLTLDVKQIPININIDKEKLANLIVYSPYHHKFNEKVSDFFDVGINFVSISSNLTRLKQDRQSFSKKLQSIILLMRPEQWIKCLLVFVPLIFAHEFSNSESWKNSIVGMIIFCLMASSVYMLNDLFDVWDDRKNLEKRNRPLAKCSVSALELIFLFFLLQGVVLWLGMSMNLYGTYIVYIYLLLNVLYSLKVKTYFLIDVIFLTSFYMIRIIFGANVANVIVSDWLVLFSFFIFLSLSFLKRYIELTNNFKYAGNSRLSSRDYSLVDQPIVLNAGVTSGIISALVLGLYIKFGSAEVSYSNEGFLWGISIIVLYWILYMWMKALRGIIKYDPVKFAIADRNSWLALFAVLVLGIMSL